MEHDKAIARYSSNVIFKIFLFILVYICLIIVGGILLWLAFQLAVIGFPNILRIRNIQGIFFAAMAILGGIGFALMFGLYLFKFLFTKKTNQNKNREVTETECPQLFEAIREVAKATSCPMPKKVFLSHDVNACVFYNTSFWSIFFPVRKNLEIGLGLFTSLNIGEVKGILAHEFGHFSQKSMKVGSGVYITNTVLYDLAFQEDKWDQWVDEWCTIDIGIIAFFGSLTRGFTNLVKKLLRGMYGMVNRSYMKLSRQMEYDADIIACKYTGKDVFISGLSKIEFTGETFQHTAGIVKQMIEKQKRPENVFQVHTTISEILASEYNRTINAEQLLYKPIESKLTTSQISLQSSWDSHPSLENRITNVQELSLSEEIDFRSAWELVPPEIVSEISDHLISLVTEQDINELEVIAEKALPDCCKEYHQEYSIPLPYRTFLNRVIIPFDKDEAAGNKVSYPFTNDNFEKIKELESAVDDLNIMYSIQDRHIEAENITYKGMHYMHKNLPVEEHNKYMESLRDAARQIDVNVYSYVINRATDEEMKKEINLLYDALFMTQQLFQNHESETTMQIQTIIATLRAAKRRTIEEITEIKKNIYSVEDKIKDILKQTSWELTGTLIEENRVSHLIEYGNSTSSHSLEADLDIKAVEMLIQIQMEYFDVIRLIYITTKIKLGKILSLVS